MAASSTDANSPLTEAADLEERYEWEEAARVYKEILQSMPADEAERPVISLRLAICHESAAFQMDSASAFQKKTEEAIAVYRETEQMTERDSPWKRRATAGRLRLRFASCRLES